MLFSLQSLLIVALLSARPVVDGKIRPLPPVCWWAVSRIARDPVLRGTRCSPRRLRRCRVRCPEEASRGATPARRANAASLRHRPGWDQAMYIWAAVIGPTPGWSSSWGATVVTSSVIVVFSSVTSVVRVLMRRDRARMDCLVAVCSLIGADPSRNARHLVTNAVVVRSRSWSLRSTGAVTRRAFSSLIAATRAVWAPLRVISNTRRASRFPRARGTEGRGRPSTWRAARRASSSSVLAPSRCP